MKFSVSYKSKYKDKADEIKCPINQLGLIVKNYPDKRFNVVMTPDITMEKAIEQLKLIPSDYTVECSNIRTMQSLIAGGHKAYLKYPATDWETFSNLLSMNVSDIYIDGPLGFQCGVIAEAPLNGTLIRVSPTVSANAALSTSDNANSFFIRPEDLHVYEPAIDIIDFNVDDVDKEEALFSIYTRGTFDFSLDQLVSEVHIPVMNYMIQDDFAKIRYNCCQVCKVPKRSCHHCYNCLHLANSLHTYLKASD